MKKRTKIIILTLMIVLLGVTGYLNIALNNNIQQTNTTVTQGSYFSTYRASRESTRDQQKLYYDSIIENGDPNDIAVVNAKNARQELIERMDKEVACEGLIKLLGFSDCVIALSDEKVNVVVQAESLTDLEVANICSTVIDQLGVQLRNIVIIYAD